MTHGEEYIAFYFQLGLATAQWAEVEVRLSHLVAFVCIRDTSEQWRAHMGFFSIENFRSKLQFADTMLLEKLKGQRSHLAEWRKLHSRLQKASANRNKLVHRLAVDYPVHAVDGRRFALIAAPKPDDPAPTRGKPPHGALCLRDINGFIQEYVAIRMQLINFAARARGLPTPLEESNERAANPMTLRSLNNLIRGALGPPPKSWQRKSPR